MTMQILMTQAAHRRLADRLAKIVPDAEVVEVTAPETFELRGQPIDIEAVKPEVVFFSFDSRPNTTNPTLFKRIFKGRATRWAQVQAAGLDNPVFRGVMEAGSRLTKSSAQATPIAEYVVAHAISLLVPLERQAELQKNHEWKVTPYHDIGQTRWVMVGYGAIGQEIAKRIKPFGVHLTVVRRNLTPDPLVDKLVPLEELKRAAADADVVVLACGLNEQTRGMCGEAFFQALNPGSVFINISRGGMVDEDALRAGLERDQPRRAVLDVTATEPLPEDHWLWDHPKVRVSAHTSFSGDGNSDRLDALFLENLRRYIAGEPLIQEASPSEVGLPSREPA
jgi:phosphoglycerate dehydrogenase-like enzyme